MLMISPTRPLDAVQPTQSTQSTSGHVSLRSLANAPVGPYPLLEAAFGWYERRPLGWRDLGLGGAPVRGESVLPSRYVPLVESLNAPAAARMVRLLPTVTWAVATPSGAAADPDGDSQRVEVPAVSYHRLLRTLTSAWRDCLRLMADEESAARNRTIAAGLWRTAVLIGGQDLGRSTVSVRVGSAKQARMLVTAGAALGVEPATRPVVRGGHTVLLSSRHQVARLWAEIVDPMRSHVAAR